MSLPLQRWLEIDTPPVDVFDLLDLPRFCAAALLMEKIRAANRELIDFQNHPDSAVVRRARKLQMLLGQTEHVLNDKELLAEFEEELWQRLRREFAANVEPADAWQPASIRQWLYLVHNVAPDRLEEGVQWILRDAPVRPSAKQTPTPFVRQFDLFETSLTEGSTEALAFPETLIYSEPVLRAPLDDLPPTITAPQAAPASVFRPAPPRLRSKPVSSPLDAIRPANQPLPWVWIAVGVGVFGMLLVLAVCIVVLWFVLRAR